MNRKPKESDWKLYSKLVPEWRDRYLERKNQEFVEIFQNEKLTPDRPLLGGGRTHQQ